MVDGGWKGSKQTLLPVVTDRLPPNSEGTKHRGVLGQIQKKMPPEMGKKLHPPPAEPPTFCHWS